MSPVCVLIPTLLRPESLTRALRSVLAQYEARELIAQIVVVDNSPEGSALAAVDALRPFADVPLVYVHEPHPGVATARNAGLAASAAPYVAFLDDDEEAPRSWLSRLFHTHVQLGADVTFGPVRGVVGDGGPAKRAYLERFFSRIGPKASSLTDEAYGCGNSVMTRVTALAGPAPFDSAADQTGGEDDRLFTGLRAAGRRFGWAADAFVYEHAPAHRSTLGYTLRRAFGYGQSPTQICRRAGDWLGVAKWMAIGVGQALVYGGVAGIMWMLRRPSRYAFADRAARGLGKVCWTSTLRFYGAAEARRTAGASSVAAASGMASLTDSAVKITQTYSL